ncbi:Papain-like cysteine protease AvrRpt2 [Pseudooceanicola antarcticus]|uniref:Papain-like cysteine protease AvrRpt2 n=1 Tax=Pseudooceanicola antarcticus TaxID=1247613 RepID=A0A285J798_9RHOB|nr:papain-like cysteine protease family protein [Pseudooceanicola antarcticus]SNY56108.1 Papain-like cysteine protease AvrRpt2 [Pseudooceanicola antarcticus]
MPEPLPVLDVPYFIQSTERDCQAAVLAMFAAYLDGRAGQPVARRDLAGIAGTINAHPERPVQALNAWANMRWWLAREFPERRFAMTSTKLRWRALHILQRALSRGSPVLVSTDHNQKGLGHILLVTGMMSERGGALVDPTGWPVPRRPVFTVHDPNGRYGAMVSARPGGWGDERFDGAFSHLDAAGQEGPGRALLYRLEGIRRRNGRFLLIRAEG